MISRLFDCDWAGECPLYIYRCVWYMCGLNSYIVSASAWGPKRGQITLLHTPSKIIKTTTNLLAALNNQATNMRYPSLNFQLASCWWWADCIVLYIPARAPSGDKQTQFVNLSMPLNAFDLYIMTSSTTNRDNKLRQPSEHLWHPHHQKASSIFHPHILHRWVLAQKPAVHWVVRWSSSPHSATLARGNS